MTFAVRSSLVIGSPLMGPPEDMRRAALVMACVPWDGRGWGLRGSWSPEQVSTSPSPLSFNSYYSLCLGHPSTPPPCPANSPASFSFQPSCHLPSATAPTQTLSHTPLGSILLIIAHS